MSTSVKQGHEQGLYLSPWLGKRPRGYGLWQGEDNVKHTNIHFPKWTDLPKKLLKVIL